MIAFFVKTTLILVIVSLTTALMRRSSAASRHLVWTCGLLAVVFLPIASALLPALPLPLLRPTIAETVLSATTSLPEMQVFEAQPAPAFPDPSPSARGINRGAAVTPAKSANSWPWLAIAWAVGTAIVLSRSVVGLLLRVRLQRRCKPATDERIVHMAASTARAMGIRRLVTVLVAPSEMMPATWGLHRPKLLLPPSASSWTDERLRVVLVHELAHVMRFDVVAATIAQAATALSWWNPLVWIAASRAQLERERACDDTVLRAGVTASTYAEELLTIAQTLPSPFTHRLALAMARPNRLGARVSSILDATQRRTGASHVVAIAASVLLAAQWPLAAAQLVPAELAPLASATNLAQVFTATGPAQTVVTADANRNHSAPDVIAARPTPPNYFEPLQRMLNAHEWRPPTPNFSGHWRLEGKIAPVEYWASLGVAPFGAEFTATQDGDSLEIESLPVPTYSMGTGRGSLAQVHPIAGPSVARFLFNGLATNTGGGGSIGQGMASGPNGTFRTRGAGAWSSFTLRDNTKWDYDTLDITTTETSQGQDYTTRIRRLRRNGDAMVVDTTTWSNYQPQVTQSRYVRAEEPAVLSVAPQTAPQPIPYGQFGAGAYRPGNGVANPYRIREVPPRYTEEALKAGLKGTVELEAVIGPDGKVTEVRVVRSLDDKLGLDENAKEVVRQTPFVPCKIGDKPVACLVVFELEYKPGPPTPIRAGQFGAGAYRPGNGVSNPVRLRAERPKYTQAALDQKIEGSAELEAVIGADGVVTDVRITRSIDKTFGLDESAMDSVRKTPFEPCKLADKPVACLVVFELQFTVR